MKNKKQTMSTQVTGENTQSSDNDGRCRGTNKQGEPCGAAATESGYCYLHAHPEMAAQLGRAGGRQNRHAVEGLSTPLPALDSVSGVNDAIAQMIADLYAKRVHPKIATSAAQLFNTLLRGLGTKEQEEKLKQLEEKIDKLEKEAAEQSSAHSAAAGSGSRTDRGAPA